ncbi:hypothetical protein TA05_11125 [Citrobacter rodentium]|jgi:hypothetical protein|uniref:Uncharacterized protein n=1 Tax=Citrobacter rodentium (strain ICC168) TaxID=637910 RepID=D2TGV9_CITRI|nr:hypothetical protein TA05_11125 [Citrobacter rodentium]CBG88122.1 hypothetical protein ROD_13581 [Citrobacter rodentium ICC168]
MEFFNFRLLLGRLSSCPVAQNNDFISVQIFCDILVYKILLLTCIDFYWRQVFRQHADIAGTK